MALLGALLAVGCGGDPDDGDPGASGTEGETMPPPTAGTEATNPGPTTGESESADGSGSSGDEAGSEGSGSTGPGDEPPGVDLECNGFGGNDPEDGVICFYDVENPDLEPAANMEYALVELDGQAAIYVKLTFAPWFADNTYGTTAIGWPGGHKFNDLVGSDHAQIVMSNIDGELILDFELDYIDDDDTAPSGYRAMGVWEGEGKMNVGDDSAILAANSSLSRNLNERGYGEYIVDSPETDEDYTPNAATPQWDYRIIYEVWVDATLFGEEGEEFTEACVQQIHASPAKSDDNTREVIPDECPPGWGCFLDDGCDDCDPNPSSDPDHFDDDCDPTDGWPPPVP